MKPGVIVRHDGDTDIFREFKTISDHGFDNCQLVSWDIPARTDEAAGRINRAKEQYGIAITAVWAGWRGPKVWDFYDGQETLGLVPVTYRQWRIEDLCGGADFAKKLGVTDIVTHAGYLPENPYDPNYPSLLIALRFVARHMADNGQRFLLETGQETPVTLLRVIEDIGTDNVFINLDPANLIMYGKGNPVDALDVFGKYVKGVHAKDGVYPTGGRKLGEEKALGQGKANFPVLIKRLHELGYDGSLTIEREITGEQQTKDILMAKSTLESYINQL